MAVRAYRTITPESGPPDVTIYHTFDCGPFDSMVANGITAWTEVWRDCDMATKAWRPLWPYASGFKGIADVDINMADSRQRHRYYNHETTDDFVSELDLSTINDGFLPVNHCTWLEIYQNGKKLPCESYTIDYTLSKLTINTDWLVPGASYEVLFWAPPSGGNSTPGT